MTRAIVVVVLLALLVPLAAADPPEMPYRAFLPMLYNQYQRGYERDNLICNGGAEYGETCWALSDPGTGNVLCDEAEDSPPPWEGRCEWRFGGWHGRVETAQTSSFYMNALYSYALSWRWQIRTNETSFEVEDIIDAYLVKPSGHHQDVWGRSNLTGDTWEWEPFYLGISPGTSGEYSILFVTITDEEKPPNGGASHFYIDDITLVEWGDCKECVVCQVLDEPPVEFCEQGYGAECSGCCPNGDDCEGLNPTCPILPPPHFYREVGRDAMCYETMEMDVGSGGAAIPLMPPERGAP